MNGVDGELASAVDAVWREMRESFPGQILVRVVHGPSNQQCFIVIPRTETNLRAGADLYDGALMLVGCGPHADFDQLIADADRAYLVSNVAGLSARPA